MDGSPPQKFHLSPHHIQSLRHSEGCFLCKTVTPGFFLILLRVRPRVGCGASGEVRAHVTESALCSYKERLRTETSSPFQDMFYLGIRNCMYHFLMHKKKDGKNNSHPF